MIVVFGHSPKYGYLNTVQEYHFGNKQWSIMPTSGYAVRGGFGHSSVWDEINQGGDSIMRSPQGHHQKATFWW